jgi:hypothetical protein
MIVDFSGNASNIVLSNFSINDELP